MTDKNLLLAMGHIDPKLIAEASPDVPYKKKASNKWVKWGAVAACLILILSAVLLIPLLRKNSTGIVGPSNDPPYNAPSPGLYQTTFHFDSYNEMIRAFRKRDIDPDNDTIQELKKLLGESYSLFVDRVATDKSFPQPMLDGEPIAYRNEQGFHNITFSVSELYGLPWIWYFPSVSTGENFYIKITYLPNEILESMQNPTASEAIKAISPNSANVNNKGNQHKKIYNETICLADREVTALIFEHKEDARNSTIFVYDDLLIEVRGKPDIWTAEWFASLSFENNYRKK